MTDLEKVLQALEHCDLCSDMPNCPGCAYLREPDCMEHLKRDIIALLRAQEAVEPEPKEVIYDDEHCSVYCPSCDNRLAGLTYSGAVALETEETPNYCWMCGQAVKRDG